MPIQRVIHLAKMTGAAGAEGHLLVLIGGQRARDLDARLWILVEPGNPVQDYVDRATALGIPVQRFIIHRHVDLSLRARLVDALRTARPDLVHTHMIHADLYGNLAARRAGVPYVISSRHNDDKFRYTLPIRLLNRWLWTRIDTGIAISDAIRRFSIDVEGAPADRIHTVHYGIDPARIEAPPTARADLRAVLNLPPDTLLIGSVCRLVEQKGLRYGLRGFARIADRVPDAHYVIAGDGPLHGALEAETQALKLADRVHFLGWRNDAHAIFAALDVFLAPSLWEGFGLVFLEAMALGVPIISTQVSAIPEVVVDGDTGWLVPPRDAEAIAAALLHALTDTDARHARGTQGRRRLETAFTPDVMVDQTLAVYQQLEGK